MGALSSVFGGWGHASPNCDASLIALEVFVTATGALKRKLPKGGSANGMPKNLSTLSVVVTPRKTPVLIFTSTLPGGAVADALELEDACGAPKAQ